jgi:hypothetical protein
VLGLMLTRATGDGLSGDSADAAKDYVSIGTTLVRQSSSPANGSNQEVTTPVTVVVRETNVGTGTLTNVNVTGGGKCTSFTPANVATLAPNAFADFTCTFSTVAGANDWSADGHGTDQFGHAAPTDNEHASGTLFGVAASTTLVRQSSTPANGSSVVVGTQATVVVRETNTGNSTITAVNVTGGGKCASAFTPASVASLAMGAFADFTCTFTVTAGSNAWTADGHGTDLAGIAVGPAGEHTSGSLTGLVLPTLLVTKTIQGTSQAFSFTTDTGLGNFSLTPADNSSASSNGGLPFTINVGPGTVNEINIPAAWMLDLANCIGGNGAPFIGTATGGTFNATYGDNVVCSFHDTQQLLGGATRTQGYWATHTALTNQIWNGPSPLPTPNELFTFIPVIGSPDAKLCTANDITAIVGVGTNEVMGGFWAGISQTAAKGGKRSDLDQARMQFLQQYLAAVLNMHAFGTPISGTTLANARTVYCTGTAAEIRTQAGLLGAYNQSGDPVDSGIMGYKGTAQESKNEADLKFWDITSR